MTTAKSLPNAIVESLCQILENGGERPKTGCPFFPYPASYGREKIIFLISSSLGGLTLFYWGPERTGDNDWRRVSTEEIHAISPWELINVLYAREGK